MGLESVVSKPVNGEGGWKYVNTPLPPNPSTAENTGDSAHTPSASSVQSQYLSRTISWEKHKKRMRKRGTHGCAPPNPHCTRSASSYTAVKYRCHGRNWPFRCTVSMCWICTPWKSSKRDTAPGSVGRNDEARRCRHRTAAR